MIKTIIIIFLSFILDIFFNNIFESNYNNLSIFTPLIVITSLILIYPIFKNKEKEYYIILFVIGLIYDLIFTNLTFVHSIIFILLGFIIKILYKYLELNIITLVIYTLIVIILYENIYALILSIFKIVPITLNMIIYKIKNSLLLNLLYIEIIYILDSYFNKKSNNKYKLE